MDVEVSDLDIHPMPRDVPPTPVPCVEQAVAAVSSPQKCSVTSLSTLDSPSKRTLSEVPNVDAVQGVDSAPAQSPIIGPTYSDLLKTVIPPGLSKKAKSPPPRRQGAGRGMVQLSGAIPKSLPLKERTPPRDSVLSKGRSRNEHTPSKGSTPPKGNTAPNNGALLGNAPPRSNPSPKKGSSPPKKGSPPITTPVVLPRATGSGDKQKIVLRRS